MKNQLYLLFWVLLFEIWAPHVVFSQNQVQCPDTIFICEGMNEILIPGITPSTQVGSLRIFGFPTQISFINVSDIKVSDNKITFWANVGLHTYAFGGLRYTLEGLDGIIICSGIAVYESDRLSFSGECSFIQTESYYCNINLANAVRWPYSFCEGDTTTVYIQNGINNSQLPFHKMSETRLQSSLGRILSMNDYSFQMVWDKPGVECLSFLTNSSAGCQNYKGYNVIVNPRKKINTQNQFILPDTICTHQKISFATDNISNDKAIWTISDGRKLHGNQITLSFPKSGTYSVIANVDFSGFIGQEEPCQCYEPDTILIEVLEGNTFEILCQGPVCSGDTAIYYSSELCSSYLWNVSSNGEILEGGSDKDAYVKILWKDANPGSIVLELPDCPGFCNKKAEAQIPVLLPSLPIDGVIETCDGEIHPYSIPYIPGTNYKWTVINNGYLESYPNIDKNQVDVKWLKHTQSFKGTLKVEYENCALGCKGESSLDVDIKKPLFISHDGLIKCVGSIVEYGFYPELLWTVTDPDGDTFEVQMNDLSVSISFLKEGIYTIKAEDIHNYYCTPDYTFQVEVVGSPEKPFDIRGDLIFCNHQLSNYEVTQPEEGINVSWTFIDGQDTVSITDDNKISYEWQSLSGPYSVSAAYINTLLGCPGEALTEEVNNSFGVIGPAETCRLDTSEYYTNKPINLDVNWSISPAEAGSIVEENNGRIKVIWYKTGNHYVIADYCHNSDTVFTLVNHMPLPAITYDSLVCKGSLSNVQVGLVSGETAFLSGFEGIIHLDKPDNFIPAGAYQVIFSNLSGCTFYDSIFIEEYELKKPIISSPEFFNTFCNFIPNAITIRTESFAQEMYYQWYKDGIAIPSANSKSIQTQQFGKYFVRITDTKGCTNQSDIYELFNDCSPGGPGGNPCPECDSVGLSLLNIFCAHKEIIVLPPFTSTNFTWKLFGNNLYYEQKGLTLDYKFTEVGDYRVIAQGNNNEVGYTVVTIPAISNFTHKPKSCTNLDVRFENTSSFLLDTSLYTMSWDFGEPSSFDNFSAEFHGNHTYSKSGIYTVKLTIYDPGGFCMSEFVSEIDVKSPEIINILSADLHCIDQKEIPFEVGSLSPLTEVWWDFSKTEPGVYTAEGNPVGFTFPKAGSYQVGVAAKNIHGCISETTKNIVVGKNLKTNDILSSVLMPKCPDVSVTLTAPNNNTYLWNTGATTRNITTVEEGEYIVTVSDVFGCAESLSFDIKNHPLSHIKITGKHFVKDEYIEHMDSMTICKNDYYKLSSLYNENYIYKWSVSPLSNWEIHSGLLQNLSATPHIVKVEISDLLSGCKVTTDPFLLRINPLPTQPKIVVLQGSLCENEEIILGVLQPNPDYTYVWENGERDTIRSVFGPGSYGLKTMDSFGCLSFSDYVYVRNAPSLPVWLSGCFESCFPFELCAKSSTFQKYTLIRNETERIELTTPFSKIILNEPGSYTLEVTHNTDPTCPVQTEKLELSPKPENHKLKGFVFWDRNENDVYDPGTDSLLVGASVFINIGNTIVQQTNTNQNGEYRFDTLPSGHLTVQAGAFIQGVKLQNEKDSVLQFMSCTDSLTIALPLRISCQPFMESQNFQICSGDSLEILGKWYYSEINDTIRISTIGWCDSILVISIQERPNPDVSLETNVSCPDTSNGMLQIIYQNIDPLLFSLNLHGIFTSSMLYDNLPSGNHTLYVKDTFGCIYQKPFVIVESPAITLDVESKNTCDRASSGEIVFLNPDTLSCQYRIVGLSEFSSQYMYENLPEGEYVIEAKDTFGCMFRFLSEINAFDNPTLQILNGIQCDSLENIIRIQTAPGATFSVNTASLFTTDTLISGLSPGFHTLYIRFENGCFDTMSFEVKTRTIADIEILPIATCPGISGGEIEIVTSEANLLFRIDSSSVYSFDKQYYSLSYGQYNLQWIDTFGCEFQMPFFIDTFPAPIVSKSVISACEGISEGEITWSGNIVAYHFLNESSWYNMQETITLPSGDYVMVVKTIDECVDTLALSVPLIEKPEVSLSPEGSCLHVNSGRLVLSTSASGLLFSLDNESFLSTSLFSNLMPGPDILYVQREDHCIFEYPFDIPQFALPDFLVTVKPACSNENSGAVTFVNTQNLQFEYNGQTYNSNIVEDLTQGYHQISIIDTFGCKVDTSVLLPAYPELVVEFPEFEPDCNPKNLEILPFVLSHGDSLRYKWDDGSDLDRMIVNNSGRYTVTISDVCTRVIKSWDITIDDGGTIGHDVNYPNIFSPKGSENNKCFNPAQFINSEMFDYTFTIFDRWGNKLFDTKDRNGCWNGTFNGEDVIPGVYVYLLEYTLWHCGKPQRVKKYGDVTVMY